jgi:FlaG/FlaF family flagellin (archaellin)
MLFKRSVSPLIATILLIVVSVILITVVLTWAKGFTQNTTNKATDLLDQSKDISKNWCFLANFSFRRSVDFKKSN